MIDNIKNLMLTIYESADYSELSKACFNPLNWKDFVDAYNNNGLVNKSPDMIARDVVNENLFNAIEKAAERNKLPLIHPEYDDYNWYCIFGNYHEKVTERINLDDWIDSFVWIEDWGTRGIGTGYYSIYVGKEAIIAKNTNKDRQGRWIIIADQYIFDSANMDITR